MKKILLIFTFLFAGISSLVAQYQIPMHIIKENGPGGENTLAPPRPWFITQDDYVLTLPVFDYAYTLVLLDEDGVVVYSADYSAGTTTAVLPSTLSGEFELRLVPYAATYYYRGYIGL